MRRFPFAAVALLPAIVTALVSGNARYVTAMQCNASCTILCVWCSWRCETLPSLLRPGCHNCVKVTPPVTAWPGDFVLPVP